ncbi:MAG: 4Fe-4S binding protein [Firmicutes bacterium]|nr:4Fe-4S binding protein [Bacillota bacterium]
MSLVNEDLCVGCGTCTHYCPMGAISLQDKKAVVNQDECVECGMCSENPICPVGAISQPESFPWPRVLRAEYSNPRCTHKTGVTGRGTEEMKTNDVTNRFQFGRLGIGVELGRPGTGARFRDFEKVAMAFAKIPGVVFEEKNPVEALFIDEAKHIREDVLNEKVLSGIVEITIPEEQLECALNLLKEVEPELETVCSVDLISRVQPDGSIPALDVVRRMGLYVSPNCKTNLGLGRV